MKLRERVTGVLILTGHERVRQEQRGRIVLVLKTVDDFERPRSACNAAEELLGATTIKCPGNSRFSGGSVVEKKVLTLRVHATHGRQHIDPVVQMRAPAGA